MAPIPFADEAERNWLNYKTGVRHIFIKIETPNRGATVALILTHPDELERRQVFAELLSLQPLFESVAGKGWLWEEQAYNANQQPISRITKQIDHVSILNEQDWPALISFLKPALIELDAFWAMARFQFEA